MLDKDKHSYRPEIDGLRALAVVAVIINHFNRDILPSGYLGVDIFFVISGFVITSSLVSRHSKNLGEFLVEFYAKRIKRLVPALVLCVLITSFLICLFDPNPDVSIQTGISSLFGLSNLYLLGQSTNYFAPSTELNVFTHTWSLGVEEQFYCFFPFLIWFMKRSHLIAQRPKFLFWGMGILSLASLFAFVWFYMTDQPSAYFLMPTRFWELGTGCLLFLGLKNLRYSDNNLPFPISLVLTVGIIATLFIPLQFAIQATITIVGLTAVLIIALRPNTAMYRLFSHPKVVYIGLISYSLYLWHWSVLSLSRWTIGIFWYSVPIQIGLMVLLSVFSYRYVETPLRRREWSIVQWKSITYGLGIAILTSVLLLFLIKIPNFSLYTGRKLSLVSVGVPSLTHIYSLPQANSIWQGDKCVLSDNSQVGKKILIENCTLGKFQNARKRVIVFGNSFSAAFTHAFDNLVLLDGYSVTITSSWGASDYYWNSIFSNLINQLRPGDWVFLINDMAEFSSKDNLFEKEEKLKQLESNLRKLSSKLSKKKVQLAVLHGNPFAREAKCKPVMAIRQWFSPFSWRCKLPSRSESLLRRTDLNNLLLSLEAKGKLQIVDLFDVFCPEEQCTYYSQNGQILYRDEYSHPSVEAARLSAPIIRKILTSHLHQ